MSDSEGILKKNGKRRLGNYGEKVITSLNVASNMQAQIILYLTVLVEKLDDNLKLKDSPLHDEQTGTDVLDQPMETVGEDGNEHDDREMEEEDDQGSMYQTETETTESEMEGDFEQEIG